jgi:MFS family permease
VAHVSTADDHIDTHHGRRSAMTKATVTKFFVGGLVAVFAGLFLAIVAVWAAFAAGEFVMDGPDVTGVRFTSFGWSMTGLMVIGGFAMVGGAIAGLVAWIGALINTAQLEDKAWFVLLLVLGLLSFGFIAMVAYVIAGPDGAQAPRQVQQPVTG